MNNPAWLGPELQLFALGLPVPLLKRIFGFVRGRAVLELEKIMGPGSGHPASPALGSGSWVSESRSLIDVFILSRERTFTQYVNAR